MFTPCMSPHDFTPHYRTSSLAPAPSLQSAIVTDVIREEKATVFTHDAKRHGFDDGDYVTFREVRHLLAA